MKLLIHLLNECFSQTPTWKFHTIQESSWEWVNLKITYDKSQKRIQSSVNWDKQGLAHLYWETGLVLSESELQLENWIRKEQLPHRVKGIAPDTNLIIPGFMTTFMKKVITSPHDIVPVLILFARSIQYELHTMRVFTYSSRISPQMEACFTEAIDKWGYLTELWNFKSTKALLDQITGLLDYRGRVGMKGSYEVDALHKWAPVIVVKPPHILHSPKVLEQSPFLNAVHDSLIRYEIDFVRQNTNLPILFITNDKDQCKAAIQEGIETLHIQKPDYTPGIDKIASKNLELERIRVLMLNLLTCSPVLRLTSQTGDYALSWTWFGRKMEDISEHKIRLVDSEGRVQLLEP